MIQNPPLQRIGLLLAVACAFVVGMFAANPLPLRAAERPNVVLVMTDDQGYGEVACHGNTMIKTPNLDRLHGESVRLTNFHVDPTCSPTRSALMTGRYSSRTGVWHTIAGRSIMRRDEVTMGNVFKSAGYDTAMFGKWHLGDDWPYFPENRGFDEVFRNGGGGVTQTPDFWGNDYFDDVYYHNGRPTQVDGYCTDVWFDAALDFITKPRDEPFFVYLATNAPHGPYLVADKYSKPYRDKGVDPTMAAFYGMITNIDENMGRLVRQLDKSGLADNTILIFMTDNGTAAGVARNPNATWKGFNDGMRGQKGSEYEGGHRVPFYIRWPEGKLGAARDIPQLAAHVDVLPTLAELCGIQKPEGPPIDGISLAGLLRGTETPSDRTLFVHSQRIEYPEKWRKSAVMTQRWRLVDGTELYDVQADPGQNHDLAADYDGIVVELRSAYEQWWKGLSERFDEFVEIPLGDPAAPRQTITAHDWHSNNVPWNHQQIRSAPFANGFWAVEVVRPGRYEFILRQQPTVAKFPLEASEARLKIAGVDVKQPVPERATGVRFTVDLGPGSTRLETWLTNPDGKSRGAFFVYARYVE